MAQTLLKVDNINVFYGNIHGVKDVSFEAPTEQASPPP